MNLQAIHNKAYKRARYIERGSAYKTYRKDRQPCPKDCACKSCKAYLLALQAIISPERFAKLTKPPEAKFFRNKSLPEHVHKRRRLAYSLRVW